MEYMWKVIYVVILLVHANYLYSQTDTVTYNMFLNENNLSLNSLLPYDSFYDIDHWIVQDTNLFTINNPGVISSNQITGKSMAYGIEPYGDTAILYHIKVLSTSYPSLKFVNNILRECDTFELVPLQNGDTLLKGNILYVVLEDYTDFAKIEDNNKLIGKKSGEAIIGAYYEERPNILWAEKFFIDGTSIDPIYIKDSVYNCVDYYTEIEDVEGNKMYMSNTNYKILDNDHVVRSLPTLRGNYNFSIQRRNGMCYSYPTEFSVKIEIDSTIADFPVLNDSLFYKSDLYIDLPIELYWFENIDDRDYVSMSNHLPKTETGTYMYYVTPIRGCNQVRFPYTYSIIEKPIYNYINGDISGELLGGLSIIKLIDVETEDIIQAVIIDSASFTFNEIPDGTYYLLFENFNSGQEVYYPNRLSIENAEKIPIYNHIQGLSFSLPKENILSINNIDNHIIDKIVENKILLQERFRKTCFTASIYSEQGARVMSNINNLEIDISHLNKGKYVLLLEKENNIFSTNFLILY